MKSINRRQALALVTALALAHPGIGRAADEPYPGKPVRLVVPFAAGGGPDTAARMLGQRLSEMWKQPVVIDNKPGGNSIIASNEVAHAKPDGYTILVNINLLVQNPSLRSNLPYDTFKDLAPVVAVAYDSLFLVASTSLKAPDLQSFLQAVRAQPGKLAFGSFGTGSLAHLMLIDMQRSAKLDMVHVPYAGSAPVAQALMSGDIHVGVLPYVTARQVIDSGKGLVLGVTGTARSERLPNVPTLKEAGLPGFERTNWIGLFVPSATPKAVITKINLDVNEAMRSPQIIAKLRELASVPGGGTVEAFKEAVMSDYLYFRDIIRVANVKLD
jgi:tripartite-type tricarboxylate transporter receptor subunit TctC